MVKFFGGNGKPFISKRQKDLSEKSIPFVLEWYGKMSLLDIYNPSLYGYTTMQQPNIFWVKYCTLSGIDTCNKH